MDNPIHCRKPPRTRPVNRLWHCTNGLVGGSNYWRKRQPTSAGRNRAWFQVRGGLRGRCRPMDGVAPPVNEPPKSDTRREEVVPPVPPTRCRPRRASPLGTPLHASASRSAWQEARRSPTGGEPARATQCSRDQKPCSPWELPLSRSKAHNAPCPVPDVLLCERDRRSDTSPGWSPMPVPRRRTAVPKGRRRIASVGERPYVNRGSSLVRPCRGLRTTDVRPHKPLMRSLPITPRSRRKTLDRNTQVGPPQGPSGGRRCAAGGGDPDRRRQALRRSLPGPDQVAAITSTGTPLSTEVPESGSNSELSSRLLTFTPG